MRQAALIAGLSLLPLGWLAAGWGGMTGHMAGHMLAVAVAAPLVAWGVGGTAMDPARRWPRLAHPMIAMVVELAVVWGWHLPAARALADTSAPWLVVEQAMFLAAGLFLWASVLGAGADRRASGVGALLLTSMHMTLLGALIGLAPRPLYHQHHGLEDQQLGGVVMLMVGAASYLLGGLAMLATLLRTQDPRLEGEGDRPQDGGGVSPLSIARHPSVRPAACHLPLQGRIAAPHLPIKGSRA